MNLSFLPENIRRALLNLNENLLTEIRLRSGQPVIVEYSAAYRYLSGAGTTERRGSALVCGDTSDILASAMNGCVYCYAEELKEGFITLPGGVRIGIAGEYVTDGGRIKTIARPTSLNIRIPHSVCGCSDRIFPLFADGLKSIMLFSRPGYGKTTMLRDLTMRISRELKVNVLVLDVRNEISGPCGVAGLGETVDVVKSGEKFASVQCAIRAMKPDVIVTDELYGEQDVAAVKYARDCGIDVLASAHIQNGNLLRGLGFDYYVRLNGIGVEADIYDKNFSPLRDNSARDGGGLSACLRKKEARGDIFGTI